MINEGKITICGVHFGVYLRPLGNLLNVAPGISPPRDLNTGDWGRAQESAFSSGFLSSSLKGGLKTTLGTVAVEGVNLTRRPSKSWWWKHFREEKLLMGYFVVKVINGDV